MHLLLVLGTVCICINYCVAPPPRHNTDSKVQNKDEGNGSKEKPDELGFEYERYLREVVEVLESDLEFKKKLEAAEEADIRSGKIAHELEYVDHNVRTKLDEVKRQEIERLRHLVRKEYELNNGQDSEYVRNAVAHIDHDNAHTFEIEDLKKLIAKVSSDLSEADKKRREEFKEYEMQKEFEKQEKLKHLEGEEKIAFEKTIKENETKHKQHEPLHHPGSKQQLEEVWEKQDHMEGQEFDPKVFFQLHDLDGNGYWDQNEVKTLFLKELDKMYQAGAPEDDMRERAEELELMREHIMKEVDINRDGLITYKEFYAKATQPDFQKDEGWETLDQKQVYTQEEYHEFERRRQEEIQRMIQQGLIPPQPVYHPQSGYHQPQYQQFYPGQQPNYQQPPAHPNGQPMQYNQLPHGQQPIYQHQQVHPNQIPQGQQMHPNQIPQAQQMHPNQIPQGQQMHPNQIPQAQQMHPNQIQAQQIHPNQIHQAQQMHPNQIPQGQQMHPNQIPQGQQMHPNQIPQAQKIQPNQVPQAQQIHPNQIPQVQQMQPNHVPQAQTFSSNPAASNPSVNLNEIPHQQAIHSVPQEQVPLNQASNVQPNNFNQGNPSIYNHPDQAQGAQNQMSNGNPQYHGQVPSQGNRPNEINIPGKQ